MMKLILLGILLAFSLFTFAQDNPPKGSKTYSPYTPEQLKELNHQPLAPSEGPFGPVATPQEQGVSQTQKPAKNSKYFNPPRGEEEAEALETESAEPYTPASPVYRF
jgi:hypothetical protein